MRDKLIELREKIIEFEDILQMILKYQIPISEGGYNFLVDQVKRIKTDLAQLEKELRIECRRKILMN